MKWSRMVLGVVAGLGLVASAGVSALAASGVVSITVNQLPVKFFFNGQDKTPAGGIFDNQGSKVPDAFIYDGTTYVPIRLVGDIFGQSVSWNGAQHAVMLGKGASGSPLGAPYFCTTVLGSSLCSTPAQVTMAGQTYQNATQLWAWNTNVQASFNLNSQYSTFAFTVGLDDGNNSTQTTVTILGDGSQLWTGTFNPGDLPKTDQISVAGVNQLTVQVSPANGGNSTVDFVNTALNP